MRFIRWIFLILILLAFAGAGFYAFAPWKDWISDRIITALADAGYANISFRIDKITLSSVTLSGVSVGKDYPLILDQLTLQYDPEELMAGRLRDLSLSGIRLRAIETEAGWTFTGLDILPPKDPTINRAPVDIARILTSLPFSTIEVMDSVLSIEGKKLSGDIPFTLSIGETVSLSTKDTIIVIGGSEVSLGPAIATLSLSPEGVWKGPWQVSSILYAGGETVPALSGKGTMILGASTLDVKGSLADADTSYRADLAGQIDFLESSRTTFLLPAVSAPFRGGRVSARNVALSMPLNVTLSIEKLSVESLLETLTGGRVSATGTVSGTLPVTVGADGVLTPGQGSLRADDGGLIQMPRELIPGDNEQVDVVRNVLENLHYTVLSAAVENGKDGRVGVRLSLEGRNPEAYNGRMVKLNVNLTGDILDFVRQNIMLFNNPEKLLEQE